MSAFNHSTMPPNGGQQSSHTFIPESPQSAHASVPYFEDIKASDIPGRGTKKPIARLQNEVADLITKLGGFGVVFVPGSFPVVPKRYGYQITFSVNGIPARIDVAALPMKSEAPQKKDRALAQCLYLVRNWLEAEIHSSVYRPGAIPLIPYLIGAGGKTVTETLIESKILPDFTPYRPMLSGGGGS